MVGGRLCVVKARCDSHYARSLVQLQGRSGRQSHLGNKEATLRECTIANSSDKNQGDSGP